VPVGVGTYTRRARAWQSGGPHILALRELARRVSHFDIVHFHGEPVHFPLAQVLPCPYVTTLHTPLEPGDHGPLFSQFPQSPLVSVSAYQRRVVPWANWAATIPYGLPARAVVPRESAQRHLLYLEPDFAAGCQEAAIEIARRAALPLTIAAHRREGEQPDRQLARKRMGGSPVPRRQDPVRWLGRVGADGCRNLLANARALLLPLESDEAPTLNIIEALAYGTPVIAYGRGAVDEILEDGLTGRVVMDVEEAARAASVIERLDRRRCRSEFERRFGSTRMAYEYIAVYDRLLGKTSPCRVR
jgi:hypothetical protein